MESSSPSKNQLTFWRRQFKSTPKSISTDSLSNDKRPGMRAKSHSSHMILVTKEYKEYRDNFLTNRHSFTGQVFGVSLSDSLSIASAEVIIQSELSSFGRIPIVVAKCGAYLKQNGLSTSGIFRIAGNNKRVKELQYIFSTPPNYGTKFNGWDVFTVHDVASVLRRFLNNLVEPLTPLQLYEDFRTPLRSRPRILRHMTKESRESKESEGVITKHSLNEQENQHPSGTQEGNEIDKEEKERLRQQKKQRHRKRLTRDIKAAIKEYEVLFTQLSDDSKQLSIYLLDLLSLFSQQSDQNLMTARNLASIFQPSILSHPDHDMDPKEYELSRLVVEFLIDYSYKLLPHLLKITKSSREKITPPKHEYDIPSTKNNVPQTIVIDLAESAPVSNSNGVRDLKTPTISVIHQINSKLPNIKQLQRPHSKSLSSAIYPPDMISTRPNKFYRINKAILLSDTEGERSEFDEDEEYENVANVFNTNTHSPSSFKSGSLPKHSMHSSASPYSSYHMTGSGNNHTTRPLSQLFNISIEELANTLSKKISSSLTNENESDICDGERIPRTIKREYWFQRLRSRSRSTNRN